MFRRIIDLFWYVEEKVVFCGFGDLDFIFGFVVDKLYNLMRISFFGVYFFYL